MRMAGPDLVLFVVGALLFGGASYAIVSDGGIGATSALGVFQVSFATSTEEVGAEPVASFRSAEASFDVAGGPISRVLVTIDCDDVAAGAAAPFALQVEVSGPNGLAAEPTSGTCGTPLEIPVHVADVPADTTVQARTEDEARDALSTEANVTAAQGTWTVKVTGGRSAGPVPLQPPAAEPAGRIVLSVETWAPTFTPVQR